MALPDRAQRADAARNRGLLMAAAEQEFADKGPEASVADIAARAGVGKGTFFRHFATKEDLIAVIVRGHVHEFDAFGRQLLDATDPGDALLEFLTVAADQREQRDVAFLIQASASIPELADLRDQFVRTVTALVTRAQESGAVRDDITGTDVLLLMCAPGHIVKPVPDAAPDLWKRYLALIFDGLRPAGAHALPQLRQRP